MILVSIIGDFYSSVLPLFYEYKEQMKMHIVVYDNYKNDIIYAQKILDGTKAFIKQKKLHIQTKAIAIDEDSKDGITQVINQLSKYVQNPSKLFINVTDGLANIGILFSNTFLSQGANILTYDRYDNEYNILTQESMKSYKIQNSIPIVEHFLLKNIKILSFENPQNAIKYREDLAILFEKYEADRRRYSSSLESNRELRDTPTGFLYERYIFNLVSALDYDDIMLGVKIQDNRSDDIVLVNEYDILIMKNNHLHMIECKYLKILDTVSLVYKLDSVRESLDEDASIMIATNFDTYSETEGLETTKISPVYKRAFSKKVFIRGAIIKNPKLFIEDIDAIFALKSENLQQIVSSYSSYASLIEPERQKMREEVNNFLIKLMGEERDYFQKETLLHLLSYKTYKQSTHKIKKAMQRNSVKKLIHMLLTMLTSKREYLSMSDIYEAYKDLNPT